MKSDKNSVNKIGFNSVKIGLKPLFTVFYLLIEKKVKENVIFFNNFFVDEKNNYIFAVL
jgi:hypothetical protein